MQYKTKRLLRLLELEWHRADESYLDKRRQRGYPRLKNAHQRRVRHNLEALLCVISPPSSPQAKSDLPVPSLGDFGTASRHERLLC